MTKTPILITGCQRSGTTLMNLVLNSHPDMSSIDENSFDYSSIYTYLNAPWFPVFVAFKLPRYAAIFSFIKSLPDCRVIWCIRDPIDVVWSMVKLQEPIRNGTNASVSWAAHPACAMMEITNSYWSLDDNTKNELSEHLNRFQIIAQKDPMAISREESIFTGALCWRIKNELPHRYETENIGFHTVKYEEFVTNPKDTMTNILDYIGAAWADDVLKHHQKHQGVYTGNTSGARPIDKNSIGMGLKGFTPSEVQVIKSICKTTAMKWGYGTSY